MTATRLILITGASRGIGQAAAVALARPGVRFCLIARSQAGLEATDDAIRAKGAEATLAPMDICDSQAINRLAQLWHDKWGRLDGLLANAAMLGPISPLAHINAETFRQTFDVNVAAQHHLIRAFDPLLQRGHDPRALLVTSSAAQGARPFWGLYAATKAALEAMAFAWAGELAHTKVRVNLLDPGRMRTRMRAQAAPGEDPQTLPEPAALAPLLRALLDDPTDTRHGERVAFRRDT